MIINDKSLIDKAIDELKKLANSFKNEKKCGKFAIEVNCFNGGFGSFKVRIEEDNK